MGTCGGGRQGGAGLGRRGGCQRCATAILACVADATCQPCYSAWQQHCKHSRAHNVQTPGCGPHLARRLRLRVSWRGASSGSAAAEADAAASGVALRSLQRQGDLRAQHQPIFPLVAATTLLSRPPLLRPTTQPLLKAALVLALHADQGYQHLPCWPAGPGASQQQSGCSAG
jgi:hypothetical protein